METVLQNRINNYEIAPPATVWDGISASLKQPKVIHISNQDFALHGFSKTMIAATILLFIIASVFLKLTLGGDGNSSNSQIEEHYSMIGPAEVNSIAANHVKNSYVNVLGPHGKLRISSKVARIIVSPNNSVKNDWNKKIAHWKDLMMTASNTDFMDVIPITQTAEVEN